MNKKIMIGVAVAIIIVVGASFYGGTVYAKMSSPRGLNGGTFTGGGFQNGAGGTRVRGGMGMGGGFTAGEILSKDATSMTIKMQDGSTKIVLLGTSTSVQKSAQGTLDDLAVGTNVLVTGTANADKSVTAQSVQIRPAMMPKTTVPAQ